MGDDSDNNSEISDSSLPPLEFASDDVRRTIYLFHDHSIIAFRRRIWIN